MDSEVRPFPRRARKSMRSQGTTNVTPNVNQSISNVSSTPNSSLQVKKNARKSMGVHSFPANVNQTQSDRTRRSVSQNTTIPLSQPSCSRDDDSSDSNVRTPRTRPSVASSLNSTVPLPQPGCSQDTDSSDSEFPPTQKINKPRASTRASKPSRKVPANISSSSPSSTSEESDVEEMLRKKAERKSKAQANAAKSTSKAMTGKSLSNLDKLVSQCVFYILVANRSKKAIKKRDIMHHVFEGRNSAVFSEILPKAASMLQKVFGFELMELKSNKNEYLLVNNLSHQYDIQEFSECSRMDLQKQGLIFYILTLIYMNENSILEGELWKALEPLGIETNPGKKHPIFEDVQKLVTNTLVKEMYLERRQLSKDPPQYELFWGERAHKEVLKEDLLEFACKIMSDTSPEEWILQYKDAKGRAPGADVEME